MLCDKRALRGFITRSINGVSLRVIPAGDSQPYDYWLTDGYAAYRVPANLLTTLLPDQMATIQQHDSGQGWKLMKGEPLEPCDFTHEDMLGLVDYDHDHHAAQITRVLIDLIGRYQGEVRCRVVIPVLPEGQDPSPDAPSLFINEQYLAILNDALHGYRYTIAPCRWISTTYGHGLAVYRGTGDHYEPERDDLVAFIMPMVGEHPERLDIRAIINAASVLTNV